MNNVNNEIMLWIGGKSRYLSWMRYVLIKTHLRTRLLIFVALNLSCYWGSIVDTQKYTTILNVGVNKYPCTFFKLCLYVIHLILSSANGEGGWSSHQLLKMATTAYLVFKSGLTQMDFLHIYLSITFGTKFEIIF